MNLTIPGHETHIHRTNIEIANLIFKYGFGGNRSLSYTTDIISDKISFSYFSNHRKAYGEAIILIHIPKNIYWENLTNDVQLEAFSKLFPDYEFDFLLPSNYIQGYFLNDKFIDNPNFKL